MIKSSISPNDSGFGRILEMGRNLSEAALSRGLTASAAVRLPVMGNSSKDGWWGPANRTAIISFSMPVPSMYEIELSLLTMTYSQSLVRLRLVTQVLQVRMANP